MPPFPPIAPDSTAAQALAALADAGWREVGAGDWAWALADPSDAWAARVTPFDPGYRMFAEACLGGPPNRWLPRMERIVPLRRDGYIVVMERLWPAPVAAASAFCAALGIPNATGYEPPTPGPSVDADDPDITALRIRLRVLLADGAWRYRLWAGSDVREGNVMADAKGRLKLVDPIGVAGWKIVDALRDGRADLLADFSRDQLEDFLTMPFFLPPREGHAERDEIAGWMARLHDTAKT